MVQRVAVIGAGAAGLAALRRLISPPASLQAVAYEQTSAVGGTWVYTERVGTDEDGLPIHATMYKNLRTNLPKEVMAFPGFPFPDSLPSFVMHYDVKQYLNDFADHFDLRKFIKFNTIVERVTPLLSESPLVWEVTTRARHDVNPIVDRFDAVIVCNGHLSIPLLPDIPGQDEFEGTIVHSHIYRHPEDFAGKRVVCLGAAASGQDISLDLAQHAKEVFVCHRKPPLQSQLPDNVTQKAGIQELTSNGVILEDGEHITDIDVLLLCTGYQYNFPFLSPECGISVKGGRITPLYKHISHCRLPTLAFIGLCQQICPFPQFDSQASFITASLTGRMKLPSEAEMLADEERDYCLRMDLGMPHHYAHRMGELQWSYNDEIATLCGSEPLNSVIKEIYERVHGLRRTKLTEYKKVNFQLSGPTSFTEFSRVDVE